MGSRGDEVRQLQLELKALGYDPGDIDGSFGPRTRDALQRFQSDYESLNPSGVVDPETAAALRQALVYKTTETQDAADTSKATPACVPDVWSAFLRLVDVVTKTPVRYGPGRGLFADGNWIVTHGPGGPHLDSWTSFIGHTYPSFHCSSWTNFFLGWLLRYNEQYTHAGNIPSLFDLCEKSDELHDQIGAGHYRGYGPYCKPIASDGSSFERKHMRNVLDIRELYDRRANLPTFMVFGQSTRAGNTWKWWHHTVMFAIDHASPGAPMHRLAADGYHAADNRWSAKPMQWLPIDESTIPTYLHDVVYRGYGVTGAGRDAPLVDVTVEP